MAVGRGAGWAEKRRGGEWILLRAPLAYRIIAAIARMFVLRLPFWMERLGCGGQKRAQKQKMPAAGSAAAGDAARYRAE